ncbi:unnamed protein product [Choristocarpus tenellus]
MPTVNVRTMNMLPIFSHEREHSGRHSIALQVHGIISCSQYEDERDELPFDVYVTPPRRKVGRVKLPPLTGCGDTISVQGNVHKIVKVSNHYKWQAGRFVVKRKTVDTKSVSRLEKEDMLRRLVYGSDEAGGV